VRDMFLSPCDTWDVAPGCVGWQRQPCPGPMVAVPSPLRETRERQVIAMGTKASALPGRGCDFGSLRRVSGTWSRSRRNYRPPRSWDPGRHIPTPRIALHVACRMRPPHAARRTPHAARRTPHVARRTSHVARRRLSSDATSISSSDIKHYLRYNIKHFTDGDLPMTGWSTGSRSPARSAARIRLERNGSAAAPQHRRRARATGRPSPKGRRCLPCPSRPALADPFTLPALHAACPTRPPVLPYPVVMPVDKVAQAVPDRYIFGGCAQTHDRRGSR
jgi:hypothetical protein